MQINQQQNQSSGMYRYIKDTFYIPDFCKFYSVLLFNNGFSNSTVDGGGYLKAGYGIRLRYINDLGKRKTIEGYGNVVFFCKDRELSVVHLDTSPEVCVSGKEVQIKAKISVSRK